MEGNGSIDMFSEVIENQFLQAAKLVESHLDSEIQKLDQIGEDELELLKEKRLAALRKAHQQKQVTPLACSLKSPWHWLLTAVCCHVTFPPHFQGVLN
ncbi:thioredoxin domain containing 9 [Cricetulus griseus]